MKVLLWLCIIGFLVAVSVGNVHLATWSLVLFIIVVGGGLIDGLL